MDRELLDPPLPSLIRGDPHRSAPLWWTEAFAGHRSWSASGASLVVSFQPLCPVGSCFGYTKSDGGTAAIAAFPGL